MTVKIESVVEAVMVTVVDPRAADERRHAKFLIEAFLAAAEASGFVMAPVKATREMTVAAIDRVADTDDDMWAAIYAAMIAARPGVE